MARCQKVTPDGNTAENKHLKKLQKLEIFTLTNQKGSRGLDNTHFVKQLWKC